MRDLGDVCGARNTQFEQEFFGLFVSETVSAHDWRDGIGDFCVAYYLTELDTMHVIHYMIRSPLAPQWIRRIHLPFREEKEARTQGVRPALVANGRRFIAGYVRQQYYFSPSRASKEIQVYRVELEDLVPFEATAVPSKSGGDAYTSLAELLLAGNGE
jgi:hypothetical protein